MYYNPSINIIANNTIKYTATKKLTEAKIETYYDDTIYDYNTRYTNGARLSEFNANVISHEFKNGEGVIVFDSDIYEIPYNAFYECNELTSIELPESVTNVSFNYMHSINEIICHGAFLPSISDWECQFTGGIIKVRPNSIDGYFGLNGE